jgi:hypothetical protein
MDVPIAEKLDFLFMTSSESWSGTFHTRRKYACRHDDSKPQDSIADKISGSNRVRGGDHNVRCWRNSESDFRFWIVDCRQFLMNRLG